jgi:hypothetical protein
MVVKNRWSSCSLAREAGGFDMSGRRRTFNIDAGDSRKLVTASKGRAATVQALGKNNIVPPFVQLAEEVATHIDGNGQLHLGIAAQEAGQRGR